MVAPLKLGLTEEEAEEYGLQLTPPPVSKEVPRQPSTLASDITGIAAGGIAGGAATGLGNMALPGLGFALGPLAQFGAGEASRAAAGELSGESAAMASYRRETGARGPDITNEMLVRGVAAGTRAATDFGMEMMKQPEAQVPTYRGRYSPMEEALIEEAFPEGPPQDMSARDVLTGATSRPYHETAQEQVKYQEKFPLLSFDQYAVEHRFSKKTYTERMERYQEWLDYQQDWFADSPWGKLAGYGIPMDMSDPIFSKGRFPTSYPIIEPEPEPEPEPLTPRGAPASARFIEPEPPSPGRRAAEPEETMLGAGPETSLVQGVARATPASLPPTAPAPVPAAAPPVAMGAPAPPATDGSLVQGVATATPASLPTVDDAGPEEDLIMRDADAAQEWLVEEARKREAEARKREAQLVEEARKREAEARRGQGRALLPLGGLYE